MTLTMALGMEIGAVVRGDKIFKSQAYGLCVIACLISCTDGETVVVIDGMLHALLKCPSLGVWVNGWILYEDKDFEDVDWQELEEVLVPLDGKVQLKAMAKKIAKKNMRYALKSGKKVAHPIKKDNKRKEDHASILRGISLNI
ncbi:hypothetical protein RIF29_40043 [Crotalaria pallida]|uniref:Uncharacterized protein n=1 Tax=Crotalaria pallida TaxID=3830 RepID=A0AAN9HTY2_CROPI